MAWKPSKLVTLATLKKVLEKIKSGFVMTGTLVHNAAGFNYGTASTGYQHIIHIVNAKTYSDAPLVFKVTDRKGSYYDLILYFTNTNATTLTLTQFNVIGSNAKHAVAVCSSNTCDVYVEKAEAYSNITVHEVYRSNQISGMTITYPNTYYGATAPSGTEAAWFNFANYLRLERTGEAAVILKNNSTGHQVQFTSANSGAGIFDGTKNAWIIYSDANNKIFIPDAFPVNSVVCRSTNTAPALGGTWTSIGSQTVGSTTVYYFKRTA